MQLPLAGEEVLDLLAGDLGRDAGEAGEEQHQMQFQGLAPGRRQDHRGHGEAAVRAELDQVGPAIGGPDLVLAADVLADDLLLDPDRLLAQILGRGHPALQRAERVDEARP